MKRRISLMVVVIMLLQIILPMVSVIWASGTELTSEGDIRKYITSGDWKYLINEDGSISIRGYVGKAKQVSIPNSIDEYEVTIIGRYAFSGCNSLEKIIIPQSVTSIEYGAFEECSSLTSITIPSSVTSIAGDAFSGCNSLESITVNKENKNYSDIDGVLFNKEKTEIKGYPKGKKGSTYKIPTGVKYIDKYAFSGCTSLENIEIPSSVTNIYSTQFSGCSNLRSIKVDEENKSYCDIDGILFDYERERLEKYPEGKAGSKYEIPEEVIYINSYAFENCSSLESIEIPSSVRTIEEWAFLGCSSLKSIVIPEGVTVIESGTFYECSSLESITIPSSVKWIETGSFTRCSNLSNIRIPEGVSVIEASAFWECSSLESIEIPSSVNRIGDWVFHGCSNLTTITIPTSVKRIGDDIFKDCNQGLKIYCTNNSEAKTYARNNRLNYITDDRPPIIETVNISPSSGYAKSKKISIVAKDSGVVGLATNAYSFDAGETWQSSPTAEFTKNGDVDIYVKDKLGNLSVLKVVELTGIIELESISIKSNPSKTKYKKGDTLNTSGLTLTAKYNDGSTQTITNGFKCTPTTLNTVGIQTITVTYGGKTATFNVEVERELTGISIKTNPTKLTYKKGESLNISGLTLTAKYNDGTTETITTGFTCTPKKLDTLGNQTVTVSYGGKTATFNVTVKKELESIKVTTPPTKTSYVVGQSFDKTGMVVQATYNDGTTANVTEYKITNGSSLTNGQSNVKITYTEGNKTVETTQGITVEGKQISSIKSLVILALVPEVVEGYTLNTEVDIKVIYNDGDEEIVSGVTVEPKVFNQLGTQDVTATYGGHTIKLGEVKVVKKELTSIKVTKLPTNTQYIEGQEFDSSGMEVEATYNNGKTANITGYKIAYGSNLTKGQTEVEISYEEDGITQKTTQTITVHAKKPTEIKVSKKPTKTKYAAGENFDDTGMEVIAYYDNGTSEKITDYAISNGSNLQQGNIDIEISYTKEGITQKTTTPIRVLRTETDSNGITWWYELVQGNAVNVHYKSGTLGAEVTIPAKLGGRDVTHLYNDGYKNIFATSLYQQNGTIEKINLPESIVVIDKFAFSNCKVLKEINIPQNVIRIDHSSFINCISLKNIEIPEGVTSIGNSAFYGCSSLTSIIIPSSVEMISNYAFKNCSSLESIVIPSSVQTISNGAFLNADKLIIYCETSSEAQSYAMKNNHSYIAISSQFEVEEVEGIKYIKNIAPIPVGNVIGMIETDGEVKAYKGSQEITNLQGTTIETGMTIKVRTNNKEIEYRAVVGRRRTNNISLRIRNK